MGLGYLVSIIYTPIMLRLLGQSEYGLYNLVASVVAYLGVLNFGFGSTYMRYYSRYQVKEEKEGIARLNAMFLIIFIGIGLVAVLAGLVLVQNTHVILGSKLTAGEAARAKTLMGILVLNLAISFPSIVFNSHIIANERFIFQKLVQMIRTVANPFVVLPVLLLGYGSVGMVMTTTALNLIIEVLNVRYCIRNLNMKFSFARFDFGLMREMTVFSSYIFINILIDQINWNVDKYLLGLYHGTVTVAVYGLAAQLNTYYLSISNVISSVFVPRVNQLVAADEDDTVLTGLFARIGRIQFMLLSLIASGILLFGRPFITLWAGADYNDAYWIALLLIIPATVPLIQNIGIDIQRAKNMHQFRSWVYFFIAVANIAMSIPLAQAYQGVGAAIGTAVSLLLGNGIVMNWYYHRKVGLDIKFFWRQILGFVPACVPPIVLGVGMNRFFNLYQPVNFMLCGLVYVLVFGLSAWFIGMNAYEKSLVGGPVRRLLRKAGAEHD